MLFDFVLLFCFYVHWNSLIWFIKEYLFVDTLAHRFLKLVGPFYFEELDQRFDGDTLQTEQEISTVSWIKRRISTT